MRKLPIIVVIGLLLTSVYSGVLADDASKKAYDKVLAEVRTLESSLNRQSSMSRVMQVFDQVEKKLVDFVAAFPGTEEAQDAKFQLGVLNANISNTGKSKKYLEDYISSTPNAERSKMGYAHFFLAETYMTEENFDKAKKYLDIFVTKYGDVDGRLLARAKADLDNMEIVKKLAIGKRPIPFKVRDITGKTIDLEKFKGKVVLLDFWATWCAPCRQEMPNVIKLYKQYHDQGFEIIGISLDNNKLSLEKYLKNKGITWPQYFEGNRWDNEIAKKYGIRSIPSTFLLDRKGKIRYKSVRGRELARAVRKLINEK